VPEATPYCCVASARTHSSGCHLALDVCSLFALAGSLSQVVAACVCSLLFVAARSDPGCFGSSFELSGSGFCFVVWHCLLLVGCGADFRPCAVIVRESALLSESGGGFVGTAPFTFVPLPSGLLAGQRELHRLSGLEGLRVEVVLLDEQLAPVVEVLTLRSRVLGEVRELDRLGVVDRHLRAAPVGVSRALRAAAESEGAE
jgi:hypothetical protein